MEWKTKLFQQIYLIRNKAFTNPGIALEDVPDGCLLALAQFPQPLAYVPSRIPHGAPKLFPHRDLEYWKQALDTITQ